jgi:NAD(P)-dependent dehydrogenase (short-subunit alcohol dehydrogenase family)
MGDSMSQNGRFAGKVALVTGASRGIGAAVAIGLARDGANVAVCARSDSTEVQEEICRVGRRGLGMKADIANEHDVKSVVRRTLEELGALDILVCNAGVRSTMPNRELNAAEWQRVLGTNLIGTFNACRAATRIMRDQGSGRVVLISSIAGQVGGTLVNVAYSATKAGIIVMTKALAKELAPFGVTVNCVAPGTIDTPFIGDYDDQRRELLKGLIPLGRLGIAEDVAGAVLYLASDDAAWVTGATIDVNGGQVMR